VDAKLGLHNWQPFGIESLIFCWRHILLMLYTPCTDFRTCVLGSLSFLCFRLQKVVWKCLANKIGPQPNCIKLTRKFKLPCIFDQHHHGWPQCLFFYFLSKVIFLRRWIASMCWAPILIFSSGLSNVVSLFLNDWLSVRRESIATRSDSTSNSIGSVASNLYTNKNEVVWVVTLKVVR
jgi:hypothetical protein